jgi:hypothetical protein
MTEQQATTYTDRLGAAMRLFADCRGSVTIAGRSLHGFGEQLAHIAPPFDVPLAVLELLRDGYSLRLSPATRSGQTLAELPFLSVLWRPQSEFSRETGWRHVVTAEAQAAVAAALAMMPPASLLIDAGPEVVAAWRLVEPLDLRHAADQARAAQVQLAERLGGDVKTAEDLAAFLPLAGRVRNWNVTVPDFIELAVVEPGRPEYTIEQLLGAAPEGGDAS